MRLHKKNAVNSRRRFWYLVHIDVTQNWSNDNEMDFVPLCKQTTPAASDKQRDMHPYTIIAVCNDRQQRAHRARSPILRVLRTIEVNFMHAHIPFSRCHATRHKDGQMSMRSRALANHFRQPNAVILMLLLLSYRWHYVSTRCQPMSIDSRRDETSSSHSLQSTNALIESAHSINSFAFTISTCFAFPSARQIRMAALGRRHK